MHSYFLYQLEPNELELRFRIDKLPQDKSQFMKILLFALMAIVGFIFLDSLYLENGLNKSIILISRFVALSIVLPSVLFIKRISDVNKFDQFGFIIIITIVVHMLVISYFRPSDFKALISWDIVVAFLVYIAVPINLRLQTIAVAILTFGSYIIWITNKNLVWSVLESVAMLAAYFSSLVVGLYLSLRLNKSGRQQFILLEQEQAAKRELEKALSEIKLLQGIIPICTSCKKIRNDKGFWEQVEIYVENHTHAEFSHGICPECTKKLYGDYMDDSK